MNAVTDDNEDAETMTSKVRSQESFLSTTLNDSIERSPIKVCYVDTTIDKLIIKPLNSVRAH